MAFDSAARHEGESSRQTAADARAAAVPVPPDALLRAVERALTERGIAAAIALLNARTRFRYTGVYRAEPPLLRNVHLFDRENPALNVSGDSTPIEATYCSIVYATVAPFATADASRDPRLEGHAALATVLSYSGVPLRHAGGMPWGVLCHWDPRPRLLPPHEFEALMLVAPLLAQWAIAKCAPPGTATG